MSVYLRCDDLVKCIVCVLGADPHFDSWLVHVRLQMVSNGVVAFQLHTQGAAARGVQVQLQLLCYSLCVEEEPGERKVQKVLILNISKYDYWFVSCVCGGNHSNRDIRGKRNLMCLIIISEKELARSYPSWAECRSRKRGCMGCRCRAD